MVSHQEKKKIRECIQHQVAVSVPHELLPIDYRCEDGRFTVPASCMTILNHDTLSSSETGVNHGIIS